MDSKSTTVNIQLSDIWQSCLKVMKELNDKNKQLCDCLLTSDVINTNLTKTNETLLEFIEKSGVNKLPLNLQVLSLITDAKQLQECTEEEKEKLLTLKTGLNTGFKSDHNIADLIHSWDKCIEKKDKCIHTTTDAVNIKELYKKTKQMVYQLVYPMANQSNIDTYVCNRKDCTFGSDNEWIFYDHLIKHKSDEDIDGQQSVVTDRQVNSLTNQTSEAIETEIVNNNINTDSDDSFDAQYVATDDSNDSDFEVKSKKRKKKNCKKLESKRKRNDKRVKQTDNLIQPEHLQDDQYVCTETDCKFRTPIEHRFECHLKRHQNYVTRDKSYRYLEKVDDLVIPLWDPIKRLYVCNWPNCTVEISIKRCFYNHLKRHEKAGDDGLDPEEERQKVINERKHFNTIYKKWRQHNPAPVCATKRFVCEWPGCKAAYKKQGHLNDHITHKHKNIKNNVCNWPGCNYKTYKLKALKQHFQRHTSLSCNWPECDYRCIDQSSFIAHMRTHTGDKPHAYRYPECRFRSATTSTLKAHERTHAGEKPYVCTANDPEIEVNYNESNECQEDTNRPTKHLMNETLKAIKEVTEDKSTPLRQTSGAVIKEPSKMTTTIDSVLNTDVSQTYDKQIVNKSMTYNDEYQNIASAQKSCHKSSTPLRSVSKTNRKTPAINGTPEVALSDNFGQNKTTLSNKQKVLQLSQPKEVIPFEKVFESIELKTCRKIAEGYYGEVYMSTKSDGNDSVTKIIPLINTGFQTEEELFNQILSELDITKQLNKLKYQLDDNSAPNYLNIFKVTTCSGKFPEKLIKEWNSFKRQKGTQNENPRTYGPDQLYITLELSNGGTDLEAVKCMSAIETMSIFGQLALSMAAAESAYEFEHRDLHWGNVLVSKTKQTSLEYRINGQKFILNPNGVFASLIDFSLSRISINGLIINNDLEKYKDWFEGKGDKQFDIYRNMQDHNGGDWQQFCPKTNIFWLHYLLGKIIYEKKYSAPRVDHRNALKELKTMFDIILKSGSAVELVKSKPFEQIISHLKSI